MTTVSDYVSAGMTLAEAEMCLINDVPLECVLYANSLKVLNWTKSVSLTEQDIIDQVLRKRKGANKCQS